MADYSVSYQTRGGNTVTYTALHRLSEHGTWTCGGCQEKQERQSKQFAEWHAEDCWAL